MDQDNVMVYKYCELTDSELSATLHLFVGFSGTAVTQMLMSRRSPEKRAATGGKFGIISGGRIAGSGGGGLSAGFRPSFDYSAYMQRREQRDKQRVSKPIRTLESLVTNVKHQLRYFIEIPIRSGKI